MGINGLLPILKSIREQKHVKEFARTRVGVDVYGWLHRGVYTCASKLCRGVDTDLYVEYCMHRVRMLIHFGATPVIVFDGAALPMKADTHAERRERRADALAKAEAAAAKGNSRAAEDWYQKACPVTPQMARQVIRQLRRMNVEYVVAPYEADAQLAWMMQSGYVQSVITEDSDLLVYGASKVLYKMTKTGDGDLYQTKNLPALDSISMLNFSDDMFLYMCVCSGCDFFKGVNGLGMKKAHTMVKKYRTMGRLIHAIRHDRRFIVKRSFTEDFARACMVFRHQTVFDLRESKTVPLRELDAIAKAKIPPGVLVETEGETIDWSFLGAHRDPAIAKKIAQGYLHPGSLKEYDDPLDVVQRPLGQRRRPQSYTPENQIRSTPKRVAMDIRGFQVQPAKSSSSPGGFSLATNLRQRLTRGSRTFNPRRIAAGFKAANKSSQTQNPRFTANQSGDIWASFKRPQLSPIPTQADTDEPPESQFTFPEAATPENRGSSGSEDEKESSPRRLNKRPRTAVTEEVKIESNDVCAPDSTRVQAVNRVLARFATHPKDEKSEKFVPDSIPPPPSPGPDDNGFSDCDDGEMPPNENPRNDSRAMKRKKLKAVPEAKQGQSRRTHLQRRIDWPFERPYQKEIH
ncbi:unnamed protein product [Chondrus crispus]|uniref:Uncharacterized protein n=1 Tax=Chondrus crispus TaxID=2769 RepID=R7Q9S7_CHOCR|nr:unnamed protein product [Chondrus crispus]CDF34814.1 unnamed protein product [Chondrus crispus]|eukprot:XP_005714633.1 unnamed protein product [Chondrus crispus]